MCDECWIAERGGWWAGCKRKKIQNHESGRLRISTTWKEFSELRFEEFLLFLSGGVSYHKASIASSVYLVSSSEQERVV